MQHAHSMRLGCNTLCNFHAAHIAAWFPTVRLTTVQHTCTIHAPYFQQMQRICGMHAANIDRTYTLHAAFICHTYTIHAPYMWHAHSIHTAYMLRHTSAYVSRIPASSPCHSCSLHAPYNHHTIMQRMQIMHSPYMHQHACCVLSPL